MAVLGLFAGCSRYVSALKRDEQTNKVIGGIMRYAHFEVWFSRLLSRILRCYQPPPTCSHLLTGGQSPQTACSQVKSTGYAFAQP